MKNMKDMKAFVKALSLTIVLAFVGATAFAGAGNRTGTSGAAELLIPVGTRDIALAGASIATAKGVEALFWNPAGVAKMTNASTLYFSHMNYIADIGVDYGAVSANIEELGVLSLSLKSLSIGDIVQTTTQNPDGTGQTFSPQFITVGLSYSRQLSDRIAVGVTTNLISERMGDVSATGVAFNVGVVYDNFASIDGLSLGVVVKNIGPQMKFDGSGLLNQATVAGQKRSPQSYLVQAASFELPSTFEFGVGYKRSFEGDNSLQLSTSFQNNNFSDDEYKLGLEYAYQDILFLRGGYNLANKETDERDFIFGATAGAGIHYPLGSLDLTVDYAYRAVKVFEANHVFSVKLGF
ncbi:MAG: PorV/PorQ family protein [Ignavibacteriae bacterium]|nr:PorV/PorQ family protein [Ignavibacteriota bacterium]